jgi:F-type H+-transporting ATPase subunit b
MYFDETAWVAIAFVIFIGLVWRKASKAITGILDSRSLLIENELKEAKSLKEEALEELRKSLQSQKNISNEAEQIIKDAQDAAKKIREDANVSCSEIIKRREEQAKQKIMALETEAVNNIKKITGSIIIESSKVFIESNLDKKENNNIINKSSNQIKSSFLN